MLKDISISSTKVRGRPKGRPESKRLRTFHRLKRLKDPVEVTFINDTYAGYHKNNHGMWHITSNCWNEGYKMKDFMS